MRHVRRSLHSDPALPTLLAHLQRTADERFGFDSIPWTICTGREISRGLAPIPVVGKSDTFARQAFVPRCHQVHGIGRKRACPRAYKPKVDERTTIDFCSVCVAAGDELRPRAGKLLDQGKQSLSKRLNSTIRLFEQHEGNRVGGLPPDDTRVSGARPVRKPVVRESMDGKAARLELRMRLERCAALSAAPILQAAARQQIMYTGCARWSANCALSNGAPAIPPFAQPRYSGGCRR